MNQNTRLDITVHCNHSTPLRSSFYLLPISFKLLSIFRLIMLVPRTSNNPNAYALSVYELPIFKPSTFSST